MSKTVPVTFGDRMFWAYDVSLGVLLLEALDVAGETPPAGSDVVLDGMLAQVEVGASFAFTLDSEEWDEERRLYALGLIVEAARRVRSRGVISAEEANQRYRINGEPYHLRMARQLDGAVIADLADRIEQLVRDELPPVPVEDRNWFFGGGPEPSLL